jgi:hypothetical protein
MLLEHQSPATTAWVHVVSTLQTVLPMNTIRLQSCRQHLHQYHRCLLFSEVSQPYGDGKRSCYRLGPARDHTPLGVLQTALVMIHHSENLAVFLRTSGTGLPRVQQCLNIYQYKNTRSRSMHAHAPFVSSPELFSNDSSPEWPDRGTTCMCLWFKEAPASLPPLKMTVYWSPRAVKANQAAWKS